MLRIMSGLRARIDYKLGLALAIVLGIVLGGLIIAYQANLDRIIVAEAERRAMQNEIRDNLRATVFDLQAKYLLIGDRLATDPVRAVDALAKERQAREVIHENREAFTARFTGRTERRDLQRPGRFVVSTTDDGVSIAHGLFEGEQFQDRVREWIFPGTDKATLEADLAKLLEAASGPDALANRVAALKNTMIDEAIAADNTRNAIVNAIAAITSKGEEVDALVSQARTMTILLGCAVVFLALLTVLIVVRLLVTKPLARLALALKSISREEDVTLRDADRSDEIGDLARGLAGFQASLEETAALRSQQEGERLRSQALLAERLNDVASRLEAGMNSSVAELGAGITHLSDAADELHSLVTGAARLADGAASRAGHGAREARETVSEATTLREASRDIAGGMRRQRQLTAAVADEAQDAAGLMEELIATAKQIDEIVQIIDDIAGRTTLLALNATIEASHAGAAGKGFAIVAEEVKKLAVETTGTTRRIRDRISEVQSATGQATRRVAAMRDRVREVDQSMGSVEASVDHMAGVANGIVARLDQAANVAESVARDSGAVVTGTTSTTAMSDRMTRSASEISQAVEHLRAELHLILAAATDGSAKPMQSSRPADIRPSLRLLHAAE